MAYRNIDTYYFDASDDGPTDTLSVWTNDSNAFDGSTSTYALRVAGVAGALTATGTNAPASGGTIRSVRARMYCYTGVSSTADIKESSGGSTLGTLSTSATFGSTTWTPYVNLTAPTGGWTWTNVQALFFTTSSGWSDEDELYRVEVEVTSGSANINNFWGAETGGFEEATSTSGAPTVTASAAYTGGYGYRLTASNQEIVFSPFESVADQGTGYVYGAWYKKSAVGAPLVDFIESGSTIFLKITANGSGAISAQDGIGGLFGTSSAGVAPTNEWFYLEVYFQHTDSASWNVFINGVSVVSGTNDDLNKNVGSFDRIILRLSTNITLDVDNIYFASGATSADDRLGGCEVYAYRSTKASVTPDDGGDNLNVGSGSMFWSYTQEVPFSQTNWAGYDGALAGAVNTDDSPAGPNGDSNITGDIISAKGIWRMDRGNGGGTDHYGLLGNNSDGTTRSVDFNPSTSPANYFMVSNSTSIVPTSSQYCQIGFECTGAQDFQCYDMLAQILHVPAKVGGIVYNPVHRMMPFLVR